MARGKNSPALFEVIRNAQQKQKEQQERAKRAAEAAEARGGVSPAAALLQSPKFWFKGKKEHEASLDAPAVSVAAPAEPSPTPVVAAARPKPVVETPVYREVPPPTPTAAPMPGYERYAAAFESPAAAAARQVREEIAAQEAPAAEPQFASPVDRDPFAADDEPQPTPTRTPFVIPFNFNLTTAVVSGFAVVVAFGVAYVIGSASHSKQQVAKATPRPDVLDVKPSDVKPTPAVPATDDDPDVRASVPSGGDSLALEAVGRPIPVPTNVKRVIGRQYLVLLSFASEDDAKDLVKFMAQNGVATTAEKAMPDYARSWTSVVTVRSFDHVRDNPSYDRYASILKDLLQKYAGNSRFKRSFKIDVYKWRAAR